MRLRKKFLSTFLLSAVLLTGCFGGNSPDSASEEKSDEAGRNETDTNTVNSGETENGTAEVKPYEPEITTHLNKVDMTKWQYNEENDVYWQSGIVYCETPADESYENLGIYVPGAYMNGTKNDNGSYTCEVNAEGTAGGFTAETAPVVIPVDTPGYTAMKAPIGYVSASSAYTNAGFVYVNAGCRGRDAGAPAGVTDLKAAVRYIRYTSDILPGNTERIFSFGMSGGGAQSALLGATGDSALYTPYLKKIGAVNDVSDAIAGSMCWCPITSLDIASEAYERNMGVTRTDLDEDMKNLSNAMAEQFALYINELGLTDENGKVLTLTASGDGIYQSGSYYDYLKSVIENSLNNFLSDTTFPYTVSSGGKGGFGGRGDMPNFSGERPDFGSERPNLGGERPELNGGSYYDFDGINRNDTQNGINLSGTYETVQDYINALNSYKNWVSYNSETNTTVITSIADFVSALKIASKELGAFDELNRSQAENTLFGYGDGEGAHFDAVMAELLADNAEYGKTYTEDLSRTDALGITITDRVNMYNPLYYLCEYYDGYSTSTPASYWRIRTGINQSDTALTTEVNLALALKNYGANVDFETVWGQAHVEAERTGNSSENFIAWVIECCR